MKIAVVGATGLVGKTILDILDKENTHFEEIYLVASEKSKGKKFSFQNKEHTIIGVDELLQKDVDVALFSAGSETSKKWAPLLAEKNCFVIDNSSAWRSYDHIPLVVPGVNEHTISPSEKIIANPNCSTIQLVLVLKQLHQLYHLNRVVVSTYQSVSGSGMAGIQQLRQEQKGETAVKVYPYQIHENCIPQGGSFEENGYTREELKLIHESRKILEIPELAITSTVVRVPVIGGHSESVNISFDKEPDIYQIKNQLSQSKGIILLDDIEQEKYPMPLYSEGEDEVFVGRIRKDFSANNAINMWIVGDNLRIGAATNAVRILKQLIQNDHIS